LPAAAVVPLVTGEALSLPRGKTLPSVRSQVLVKSLDALLTPLAFGETLPVLTPPAFGETLPLLTPPGLGEVLPLLGGGEFLAK
jgi:hypothetical protein